MKIEILGMGCQSCSALFNTTKQAAEEMGIVAEFVKVEDINQVIAYGVINTPALVVDGVVKVSGKVPDKEELKAFLK